MRCRALFCCAILALLVAVAGCKKAQTPPPAPAPDEPRATALPEGATPTAAAAALDPAAAASPTAAAPFGDPGERRRRKPTIIGGCDEACATPEQALVTFLHALGQPDRPERLRPLVEWSLLEVDGKPLGERWAEMWGDPAQHDERAAEIEAWLKDWPAWVERIAEPDGLARTRAGGVRLERLPGVTDRVIVHFRHPKLRDDTTAPTWRLEWTLRGFEWLLSRVDHRPGEAPAADR